MSSTTAKRETGEWKIGTACFLLSLFYFLAAAPADATTVSGTFKRPDGAPINGTVEFVLSQQAKTTTPPVTYAPVLTTCPVTGGDISPGCAVQGNDTLDPAGTFYRVRVLDLNNTVVLPPLNYTIAGAAVDLGELPVTATETLVPPTGSVTGNMNVTGNLTVGGSATFGADPQTFANLDVTGNLRLPGGGSATFMRVNQIRLVDPNLWSQPDVTAKLDAAITDCFGECRILLPTDLAAGSHTRSTWPEASALLDLRGTQLDPFTLGRYFSPFKLVSRKTADNTGTLDLFSTLRALLFHDSGGDNVGGGPKDTYFTFAGDLYSAGRGEDHSVRGAVFKYGEGDAVAFFGLSDHYGNCLEAGGECAEALRGQTRQGQAVTTGTVDSYTGGSRNIAVSSGAQLDKLGVGRVIINTTGAKVHTAGSVASIGSTAPPVVTGSGTTWATTFGAGAHSDLCFSQNDDDAAGFKFVVPIRSIGSDTSLTLDYDPQALDKAWPGDNNGSSYRIYKCALIESHSFQSAGATTATIVHQTGGTTDWAATDTLEVPLGWAWYGSGANIIVQNNLPGMPGNVYGLNITNTGSDEALDRAISVGGKAAWGLAFNNAWECPANNVNCNTAGFTTGIRFLSPPTVGLSYAGALSGINEIFRLNDQSGGSTGNVRLFYSTTADGWNVEHGASTGNVIQLFPVNGTVIADVFTARSTGSVRVGTNPATAGGVRLANNTSLQARNAANSANIVALSVSASDRVQLAQSGTPVEFAGGVHSDGGGFKHRRVSTGSCGTSGCQVTVSWTTAFADTNYSVNCSVQDSTAQSETTGLRLAKVNSIAAASVTVDLDNLSGSAITGTVHCTAIHD